MRRRLVAVVTGDSFVHQTKAIGGRVHALLAIAKGIKERVIKHWIGLTFLSLCFVVITNEHVLYVPYDPAMKGDGLIHEQDASSLTVVSRTPTTPKDADWPPTRMLDNLLRTDGSSRRRLVVAASNSDYVEFADNFAHSLLKLSVTNFVLVPLDHRAYRKLHAVYPKHTLPLMPGIDVPAGNATFDSPEFKKLTAVRPLFLRAFLEKNYTIFYNDIDMVWQHNAWNTIDERERSRSDTRTTAMIWQDGKGDWELCTCLLYLHPTSDKIALLNKWEDEIATGAHADDQQAFTAMARQLNFPFAGGSTLDGILVFPNDEQFPAGSQFPWNNKSDANYMAAVIVHNNWIIGKDNKRIRFGAAGLWKPSGKLRKYSVLKLGRIFQTMLLRN
jgi:hypothetical protein